MIYKYYEKEFNVMMLTRKKFYIERSIVVDGE